MSIAPADCCKPAGRTIYYSVFTMYLQEGPTDFLPMKYCEAATKKKGKRPTKGRVIPLAVSFLLRIFANISPAAENIDHYPSAFFTMVMMPYVWLTS